MRTDRLLHYGVGLLAVSLLLALGLANVVLPAPDRTDVAALALVQWLRDATLVGGVAMLVGHVVVRLLTRPSIEDEIRDWYADD